LGAAGLAKVIFWANLAFWTAFGLQAGIFAAAFLLGVVVGYLTADAAYRREEQNRVPDPLHEEENYAICFNLLKHRTFDAEGKA